MKKNTLLILFLACQAIIISNLFAQQMTYTNLRDGKGISIGLKLNSYDLSSLDYKSETMHEINLSGIFIPNDEGMPNLPTISRFVAVPKGAEVRVSVKRMETERLQNINIAPALRIQAIPEEPVMDYVKNDRVYETNEFYPQNIYNVSEAISLRGVNTVMVGITPFQFNPVTKELIVITDIELEVEYIGGSKAYDDPKYRSPWFDPILKNALLNYEVLQDIEYTPKTARDGTGCEYLIVIPNREDFRPYAEQIKEFRTKQGIYTKIMSLSEMGVTTTAQLKTWFHNAYNTWNIPPVAVLLMGDHSTNMALGIPAETISHPYPYPPTNGSCITDNQYASLNSSALLPDMVFGRMAAETESDMAVLASKFIEYETQPCMESNYYQNPITALGFQTERWFQICSEAVGGYWRNMGKTPVRINAIYDPPQNTNVWSTATNTSTVLNYFGPSGTGYIPTTPTELGGWSGGTAQHVINAVNNGAFALQHRDHGFENGWGEPDFQSSHISQFTNVGKMTYVFTINCLTGRFHNPYPCFGEVFHRYTYQGQNAGCVGFLGPTEVSYSFVNDTYAWGMYDLYDPDFLPTYGPQGPYSAACSGNWMPAFGNVAGKYFLAQSAWPYNSDSKKITYQMFTAHSDVFLRLFTEVPQTNNVNHAEVTLAGNPHFLISAGEGTLIALTTEVDGNLEILAAEVATGGVQTLTIPSTLISTTEINVVVTGQNYLRYEAVVTVVPAEGPYIVPTGYTVENEDILTYISENSEISVILKNVGVETTNALNVTIFSNDPQLTINQNTAECAGIAPDETKTANFNVTVANDIPNNKIFSVDVTVTENGKARSWESKLALKAFAPVLSLKKVLINDVENGNLPKGSLVKITTIVENKGGADAYSVIGELKVNDPNITIACGDEAKKRSRASLQAGESMSFDFYILTNPNMPFGHTVNFDFLLSAMYEISYETPFTATCSGSNAYCAPGSANCGSSDRFTSVKLTKVSDQSVLINHNPTCVSGGYNDYTTGAGAISVNLIPGEQYKIEVSVAFNSQKVRGWFDLNGNKEFEGSEELISFDCSSSCNQTFTIPQNGPLPGTYRFRLRTTYSNAPSPCSANNTWGQALDYALVIPDLYPKVQNVKAELGGSNIAITWEEPAEGTPIGYNVYRDGVKLNTELLTNTNYTENITSIGIYVYQVTAVYEDEKESIAGVSNVICYFLTCEKPVSLQGTAEKKTAILTWEDSDDMEGTLLGYNVYRNETIINEEVITANEYLDENLEVGTYNYQVSAVYVHCPESEPTEDVTVIIDPEFCEAPTSLSVTPESNAVVITWEEPENIDGELSGYNIYRDEFKINKELLTELEYRDEELPDGTYIYQVSAVYEHCNESEWTEGVEIVYVGINDIQSSSYNIHPNPTTGEFTITSYELRITDVEIYDVFGRKVLTHTANRTPQTTINVEHLQTGTYFVRIYSETNDVAVKRLVIMK
jgi:hypothetical protein